MTLPKAVAAATEELAALEQQLQAPVEPETPPDGQTETPPAPEPSPEPAPAAPVASTDVPHPEPQEVPEEKWEHKYRRLQGKYDAEVPRLHQQVKELLPLGGYQPGADPEMDEAVNRYPQIAEFLQQGLLHSIQRWELCAFNNLCRDKYRRLDKTWAFENTGIYARQALEDVERIIQRSGFPKEKFQITGLTRAEG